MWNKSIYLLFIPCSLLLLLTGCWDEIQIEDRGFVIGSAIDLGEGGSDGNQEIKETNQFVVPMGYGNPGQGGGGQQKAFANLSATGNSVYAIDREMGTTTSKIPFFGHLKVIILSMELAQTPHLLDNLMDIFIRDIQMRRGIKVIVSEGEAKEILDIEPENEKLPAVYINSLLEHSSKSTGIYKPILVGDIHEHLINKTSFTLPLVSRSKKRMVNHGGAVYKGIEQKVVGRLNKKEMRGLNIIAGKYNGELIEFHDDDQLMTFEIQNIKSKIKIDTQDKKNLDISIIIHSEGRIAEILGRKELKTEKDLKKVESKVEAKIEEIAKETIEKAQKEFNADIFGIKSALRQKHYDTWKKMKNDWEQGENYFAKSNIHVKAKVRIRQPGNAQ